MLRFGNCNCDLIWLGMTSGGYEQARNTHSVPAGAPMPSISTPGNIIKTGSLTTSARPGDGPLVAYADSVLVRQGLWSVVLQYYRVSHEGPPGDLLLQYQAGGPNPIVGRVEVYDENNGIVGIGSPVLHLAPSSFNPAWGGAGAHIRLSNANRSLRYYFRAYINYEYGALHGDLVTAAFSGGWSC